MTIVCKICGKPLPPGRHAYCSDACAHIGRRSSQRDWQRAYYARQQKMQGNLSMCTPRACKICGAPLTGRQRYYCQACIDKYPKWYDRQLLAQPEDIRETFARQQKQNRHEQYLKQQAAMTPEQQDARRADVRVNARAYYLRHINATPDESDAFRQKLRDRASAYYARKKQACSDTPDADASKAEPK